MKRKGGGDEGRMGAATGRKTVTPRKAAPTGIEKSATPSKKTYPELLEEPGDLPDSYGVTRVVLLPVHPYLVHAYWEVHEGDLRRAARRLRTKQKLLRPTLRFYDVTAIVFDGTNACDFFDIDVDLRTRNWYVDLWSPDKWYIAELGLRETSGRFAPIARSNPVELPSAEPSERREESYLLVLGDYDLIEPVTAPPSLKDSFPATVTGYEPAEPYAPEPEERELREYDHAEMQWHDRAGLVAVRPRGDETAHAGRVHHAVSEPEPPRDSFPFRQRYADLDLTSKAEHEFIPGIASNAPPPIRET